MSDLLARLKGVIRCGDGWTALCPTHDDRQNSLSINYRDGRWLLKCHAGCEWQAIAHAVEIDAADLFDDEERQGRSFHPSNNRATTQPTSGKPGSQILGLTLAQYATLKALPIGLLNNREPSLSISDGDHGKVLVRCHAGCERERVIAALRSRGLWTGYDTAPDGELCGLTVHLPDQCKCGDNHATIGEGRGPHRASLRCPVVCIAAGRSATTYNFIATIIQKFGCATTPIRIRRGAQTECASVVSPTQHVMSRKENRHAKT